VVEAMGYKVITLTSSAMASPPYKISSTSINMFKNYLGEHKHTCRQTGDLIRLLSFLESRLKMYECVFCHGNAVNAINIYIWTY
jgi:hypothetical protein